MLVESFSKDLNLTSFVSPQFPRTNHFKSEIWATNSQSKLWGLFFVFGIIFTRKPDTLGRLVFPSLWLVFFHAKLYAKMTIATQ